MLKQIILKIPGPPTAKGRPRKGKWGNFYTPAKTQEFEKRVKDHSFIFRPGAAFMGLAVSVDIYFYVKSKARCVNLKRPDLDNYIKAILDGLNGVMYNDDSQVFRIRALKFYNSDPETEIILTYFNPENVMESLE